MVFLYKNKSWSNIQIIFKALENQFLLFQCLESQMSNISNLYTESYSRSLKIFVLF